MMDSGIISWVSSDVGTCENATLLRSECSPSDGLVGRADEPNVEIESSR